MTIASKVVVLGNCQAHLSATYLTAGGAPVAISPMPPVYEMAEDMRETVGAELDAADIIFAQRIADDYPLSWVRTSWLREKYGTRLISWPNIYFDGYFPDTQYLYHPGWGKVLSPLEDYHFGSVIRAFQLGRTAAEAATDLMHHGEDGDPFAASLQRLRERESGLDVAISDFLVGTVAQRRAFYTPNHPCPFVMVEMTRRLSVAAGLPFDPEAALQGGYQLDRIYIPTHRGIARANKLSFDVAPLYRGLEVLSCDPHQVHLGHPCSFELSQLIETYYRIYKSVFYC